MTTAGLSLAGYALTVCRTRSELDTVAEFRKRIFAERSGLGFDDESERRFDETAVVNVILRRDGEAVSAVRSIPFPSPGSPLTTADIEAYGADSEVGRLAALPGADSPINAMLALCLGALWVTEHTVHTTYISYAHPVLLPLYEEVGADDTGQRCDVAGRSAEYCVLVGSYADCVRLGLKKLGVDQADALAAISE